MTNHAQTQELLTKALGDKYEVIRWIGGGGMAQVFLAQHKGHGGLAAIKVLAETLAEDPKIVERFKQEARTAASLTGHPNIVTIFDVGEMDKLHYLVMQFVEGEDLSAKLRREGKLPPEEALGVVRQVASALEWAGTKGVVHRDLKPANIRIDKAGRALVLDFGIAKAADVAAGLTLAGETLGTPYYMSPEQIRGEKCDQRSDLYALGVILYELVTGERPFTGDNYFLIQQGHLQQPVPAVGDAWLDAVVGKLMAKRAEERYQAPAELLADLAGPTTPTPIPGTVPSLPAPGPTPGPAPLPSPTPEPAGTKPWIWIAGGGVLAVVAAVVAWIVIDPMGAKQQNAKGSEEKKVTPVVELPARIDTETGPMVLVKAGEFPFGEDAPQAPRARQRRTLPDFYIDQHEVTNASYLRFCEETRRPRPAPPAWDPKYLEEKPDHPVVGLSYDDAVAYARWAKKRLPTEEEWEKAARGVEGRPYPWGFEPPAQQVNWGKFRRKKHESTLAAGTLPEGASPYDARHMAGNVWEWTSSPYMAVDELYQEMSKVLGSANLTHEWYTIKGGSFVQDEEIMMKSFMRTGFPKDQRSDAIPVGFRCVKDPQ